MRLFSMLPMTLTLLIRLSALYGSVEWLSCLYVPRDDCRDGLLEVSPPPNKSRVYP